MFIKKFFIILFSVIFLINISFAQELNIITDAPSLSTSNEDKGPTKNRGLKILALTVLGAAFGALVPILVEMDDDLRNDLNKSEKEKLEDNKDLSKRMKIWAAIGAGAGFWLGVSVTSESKSLFNFSSKDKCKINIPSCKYNSQKKQVNVQIFRFNF